MFARISAVVMAALVLAALMPVSAFAHCDTEDGPVVAAAKLAIEKADVTPVLMWVQPEQEAATREALARTLAVRRQSDAARELADRYFFETVVRLHRQAEGAPYTGLKGPGEGVDPLVAAADRALESGNAEQLTHQVNDQILTGLRARLARAQQARKRAGESVEAGREYVAAYVDLMHYLERLGAITAASAEPHEHAAH